MKQLYLGKERHRRFSTNKLTVFPVSLAVFVGRTRAAFDGMLHNDN
jgi:hypothetical protein